MWRRRPVQSQAPSDQSEDGFCTMMQALIG